MNDDVHLSRRRISRRRALAIGGTIGLGGVVSACSTDTSTTSPAAVYTSTTAMSAVDLLELAPQCVMSKEETEGPYWFDVDAIRNDIREDRPGTAFELALRVQDVTACTAVSNAVVEIWHCDAGGEYSGFESGSMGGSSSASDGSYSTGDRESTTTDDGTYLRGALATNSAGVVVFTTIFPGWYRGRTTHIHLKVHIDRKTVLTSQLFFDPTTVGEIYAASPYSDHAGWESNTQNTSDTIYDPTGLVTTATSATRYLGAINLGVDV